MKQLKARFQLLSKKERIIGGSAAVLLLVIALLSYGVGHGNAAVELSDKKVKYEEMDGELLSVRVQIKEANEELEQVNTQLADEKGKLDKLNQEHEEVLALVSDKESIENEKNDLVKEIGQQEESLAAIMQKISDSESKLDQLNKGIVEKQEQPRTLPAGYFTVGEDLEEGRYKIEPSSGSGNYFVNDGRKANIILGRDDSFYLSEYIIYLSAGDQIQATLPVKYTGVE
ncbi:hypothetical protein M3689_10985 [Alkalihalophilus marmarensis]|jgi:DNA repair ATPase RecN|uniref:hypothetical protein n=1 Tax=Alkalihalophilus marmarensis TaxID=521377 RepID=UPI00203D5307|nr:hypothetical protein [Alkalihalophilus marmarensis]MCM3489832.1 hypothetical protein [Alkalihalophilus marmarensis]